MKPPPAQPPIEHTITPTPAGWRLWLRRFLPSRHDHNADSTKALGNHGERLAAKHLRRLGYRIVARNMVIGNAEADLIALTPERRAIVIIEVKARRLSDHTPADTSSARARSPEAAITAHKRAKLRSLARALAARRRWAGRPVRIDVIAIDFPPGAPPILRHHTDAVR